MCETQVHKKHWSEGAGDPRQSTTTTTIHSESQWTWILTHSKPITHTVKRQKKSTQTNVWPGNKSSHGHPRTLLLEKSSVAEQLWFVPREKRRRGGEGRGGGDPTASWRREHRPIDTPTICLGWSISRDDCYLRAAAASATEKRGRQWRTEGRAELIKLAAIASLKSLYN